MDQKRKHTLLNSSKRSATGFQNGDSKKPNPVVEVRACLSLLLHSRGVNITISHILKNFMRQEGYQYRQLYKDQRDNKDV